MGWDFFRRYRLDLIWGDYGDLFLRDKKAKIAKRIENVAYPQNAIPRFNYIAMRTSAATKFEIYGAKIFHTIADEASAPKEHKKEYVELLKKYKSILKLNFNEATTKHRIEHEIRTSGPPCKAKTRPLMPGSPKVVKGRKAWMELLDLGIIAKVPPNTPVPWSSALHLQPKGSGEYRLCGDFRPINAQTEHDGYPLPSLRHFTHKLKGA